MLEATTQHISRRHRSAGMNYQMQTYCIQRNSQSFYISHYFTSLVILRAHERVLHNETLTEIRSIISGRSTMTATLRQCVTCCKAEGKPYLAPLPSPLPKFRVREQPPLAIPLLDPCISRRQEQRQGNCLYTCVVWAVHLNIVSDLTMASFSFNRFIARHGMPTWMVSDNSKEAAKTLERIMQDKVQQHLAGVSPWSVLCRRKYARESEL